MTPKDQVDRLAETVNETFQKLPPLLDAMHAMAAANEQLERDVKALEELSKAGDMKIAELREQNKLLDVRVYELQQENARLDHLLSTIGQAANMAFGRTEQRAIEARKN